MAFWTDSKIADEFTPEDKYFYLYLLTNPHTNTCGCYELSPRQMAIDTGYAKETVEKLLDRMEKVHNVIQYSATNKEILIINWRKYNWTYSPKLKASVSAFIKKVKTKAFRDYLLKCYEDVWKDTITDFSDEEDEPLIPFGEEAEEPEPPKARKKKEPVQKHIYGEYKHVRLSDAEYERLINDYGEPGVLAGIDKVDKYCQRSGRTYRDYNLVLRDWGIEVPKLEKPQQNNKQVKRVLQ